MISDERNYRFKEPNSRKSNKNTELHCNIIKFQLNAARGKHKQKSCQSLPDFPLLALSGKGRACSHCQLCPFSQLTTPLWGCEIFLHISRGGPVRPRLRGRCPWPCLAWHRMQIAVEVNLKALNIYASALECTGRLGRLVFLS